MGFEAQPHALSNAAAVSLPKTPPQQPKQSMGTLAGSSKGESNGRIGEAAEAPRASPSLTLAEALLGGYPTLIMAQEGKLLIPVPPQLINPEVSRLCCRNRGLLEESVEC
eukprot:scaffold82770_cov20-Tisochrysis_lutea.AAC.1